METLELFLGILIIVSIIVCYLAFYWYVRRPLFLSAQEIKAKELIELSSGNTAGTTLDADAIRVLVAEVGRSRCFERDYIDWLIDQHATDGGYLVKTNDVISICK